MNQRDAFDWLLLGWFTLAVAVAPVLLFMSAPYGRHVRAGWGPTVDNTLGWILMEAPSPLVFAATWWWGDRRGDPVSLACLAIWQLHYLDRAFLYPHRLHRTGRRMPVLILVSGALFNVGNAWLNGTWVNEIGPARGVSWFADPRFLLGAAVFASGFSINRHADSVLLSLRKPGETGYKVPHGGMYRYVTAPNYLGEILEWCGWALLTWSLAGLSFAVWTAANLAPRARDHHRWYRERFPDYPEERRALVPGLW